MNWVRKRTDRTDGKSIFFFNTLIVLCILNLESAQQKAAFRNFELLEKGSINHLKSDLHNVAEKMERFFFWFNQILDG